MARTFSRAEADALLLEVRPLLERGREIAARLGTGMAQSSPAFGGNGHGAVLEQLGADRTELQSIVERLNELGIVYRDPATGLIDFPAELDGRPVFLCWRLGEDAIAWWHDRDAGIAGRTPLD